MFQWTEASVSSSNRSAVVTYEHADSALSSTCLQSIGGNEEAGGPSMYDPHTPGLMVLEDLGAGAAFLEAPAPAPCTSKSYSKFPMLSPSRR
jgi:hypothetical protein